MLYAEILTLHFDLGKTYREIAEQLRISTQTVAAAIYSDPAKVELYRALAREEWATLWKENLRASITDGRRLVKAALTCFFGEGGEILSAEQLIEQGPRWAAICRQSASDAQRHVQLLAGDPTERIAAGGGAEPSQDLVQRREAQIRRAIEADRIDLLPPELQVLALRRVQKDEADEAEA